MPEVYAQAGTPLTWHAKQMAACLWAGEGSAASHRAAARLWRLNGFSTAPVELSTIGTRRPFELGFRAHRVDRFILDEIVLLDRIPTTSVRKTLLDLAGLKLKYTASALDQSLRLEMTSLSEMWALYEQEWTRGRRGIAILREMLIERSDGQAPSHSEMETMMERLIRRGRLAKPRRQWPVTIPTGPIYLDFAYPHRSLDIECDSYAWHMDREAFERDRRRDAELQRLGWTVLRFTWSQLKWQSDWVISQIRHHLDSPRPSFKQRRVVPER
jgi:very-short-patch-repair endonuclease